MKHSIMMGQAAAVIAAILVAVGSLRTVTAQDGLPPTSILINIEQPLSAGRRHEITCTAIGWETPPNITWWIGDQQLPNATLQESDDGDYLVSTLELIPTPYHNGKTLACRAAGDDGFDDDFVHLNVYFAPLLEHRFPLDKVIEEGSNVYFTCTIVANPRAYNDMWLFQGRPFEHNPCAGVHWLPNGNSAVEKVTRHEAGDYTCMAANVEGETTSSPLRLTILYKPDCIGRREKVYEVPPNATALLVCEVDAEPEVEGYRWAFNSTTRRGTNRTEWRGGSRERYYTPVTDQDYGSFYCWARSALGEQQQPCVFHVMPGGKPEEPINCTVTKRTPWYVEVKCAERFDGGHRQSFRLAAFDISSGKPLYNATSQKGEFLLDGLEPRQALFLEATAFSVRGRSETVTWGTTTLADDTVDDEEREELSNCSVLNRTSQSLMMVCLGGFDDDRTQSFLSEVFDSTASLLFTRAAQKHQIVMVNGIGTKLQWRMRMLADNYNGKISAVVMDFPTHDNKDVTIVEPHSTRILPSEPWLLDGKRAFVTCRTVGSQPPAYVTWWLDNQRLFDSSEQVLGDGSETLSTVRFMPTRYDDGAVLTCRAENPYVSSNAQEHSVRLCVCYPPKVAIYLERPLRSDDIREGDNVDLKCQVLSNPPAWRVKLLFQGRVLEEITWKETINETLTFSLGPVNRTATGSYSCVVSNAVGETHSPPLLITVQHKPVCRSQHAQVSVLPQGQGVLLDCEVDAVPPANGFRWMFNSSMEADGATMTFFEWPSGKFRRVHRPVNDLDYGTFSCWAYNTMGVQDKPCLLHVTPPGKPHPPTNCSMVNKTSESFVVQCEPSTDGGRRQSYHLEVFDVNTGHVVLNATQWSSSFLVTTLWPKRPLTMRIAAISPRGRSQWLRLPTFTLLPPDMMTPRSVMLKTITSSRESRPYCGRTVRKVPCPPKKDPRL